MPLGTKIGEWSVESLPDHLFFQEGPGLREWQWSETGMKVINGRNILPDGTINTSNTERFISMDEFNKRYSHFAIETGDIVLTSSGTIGKVSRIKREHLPLMMNTSVIRFHPKPTAKVDPSFLYQFFRSRLFLDQAESFAVGSAQQNFGPAHLKQMRILLPPLAVQRKIAAVLSTYDDLIGNNTRRIQILEEMAQALYREWFVHFRFPGHEQSEMVGSEVGLVPQGWQIQRLADVADVNAHSIRADTAPDTVLYVDIASVGTGRIEGKTLYAFAEAPGRARRAVRHGDIIWSCVRPNRKSYALIMRPEQNLIVSTGFAVLSARTVPYSFLYQTVTTDQFVSYLVNHATGAAYPAVSGGDFDQAYLTVPPSALLDMFHKAAEPMYLEADLLMRKNHNLRLTRDLLLPKLISGEVAVDDLDIETGELT